jgi:hypothetical protein
MQRHLAIFSPSVIDALFNGTKTIESRFSKNKIAPYLQVSAGDVVYIKPSGEDIIGQFTVKKVLFLEGYSKEDFDELIKTHWSKIGWGNKREEDRFKKEKREESRYITLIWIDQVERFLTPPVRIRKSDNRAWVVLDKN